MVIVQFTNDGSATPGSSFFVSVGNRFVKISVFSRLNLNDTRHKTLPGSFIYYTYFMAKVSSEFFKKVDFDEKTSVLRMFGRV
jgi:hypothetical protein